MFHKVEFICYQKIHVLFFSVAVKLFQYGQPFVSFSDNEDTINYQKAKGVTVLTGFANSWLEDFIVYTIKAIDLSMKFKSIRLFALSSYPIELVFAQTQLMNNFNNTPDKLEYIAEC
ncbi:Conserved_hypothetical protein [Hexamita inflata]|uniref:Uncharacterized protein n=1 Tax=Hexamita inflata TaxID=28002 RepID=A0ABP1J6N6_9EUKA